MGLKFWTIFFWSNCFLIVKARYGILGLLLDCHSKTEFMSFFPRFMRWVSGRFNLFGLVLKNLGFMWQAVHVAQVSCAVYKELLLNENH